MAFVFLKFLFYVLILISLSLQTTARRSQMLSSSNDTANKALTNDTTSTLTNDNNISTPSGTNHTKPIFSNDDTTPTPTTANDNNANPEKTEPQTKQAHPKRNQESDTSSTPPYDTNDVVSSRTPAPTLSPPQLDLGDHNKNDMSFSPVPAPSYSEEDGDDFDYGNLPPSVAPATPDTEYYDGDWTAAPATDKPTVLPSAYEADDEVEPELAAEIEAYTAARERNSRTLMVVVGFGCLIGVGGFVYKMRKEETAKKSQYEYLSKKDDNQL